MKKPKRDLKLIVLSLLAALALLSSCGTPSVSAPPAGADAEPKQAYSWSGKISNAPYLGAEPEDDIVTKYICERLLEFGIELEYELVYLERTQYSELLNLRLASGDAPDMFYSNSIAKQAEYYKQGLVKTWTEEFFRENAPTLASIFDNGGPNGMTKGEEARMWGMSKASDGRMITIPIIYFENNILNNIQYNGKWLEALGVKQSELPTTLDEFEALMRRFVDEDPDGNGKKDTYGFSNTMFNTIYGAYGTIPGVPGSAPDYWLEDGNGGLVYGFVKEGMREGLEKLAYYYAEGLIDPEFVTGENTGGSWAISHALANGRIGVTRIAGQHYFTTESEYAKISPETGTPSGVSVAELQKVQGADAYTVYGPSIYGPNGHAGSNMNSAVANPNTLFNASMDDEKLAACLRIMEAFAIDTDMAIAARYGLPNEHWKIEGTGKTSTLTLYSTIPLMQPFGGTAMRNLYGPADVLNDECYRLIGNANPEIRVCLMSHEGENMRVGYINQLYASLESVNKLMPDLQTSINELIIKIIRGDVGIEEYDKFVEAWKKNGGDTMTNDVNEWYKTVAKK